MNVSIEFEGWNEEKAKRMIDTIYQTTLNIFKTSEDESIPTNKAADLLAERRLEAIKNIKHSYLGNVKHRFPGRRTRND